MTVREAGEGRRGDERVGRALARRGHDGAKQLRLGRTLGSGPARTLWSDLNARVTHDPHEVGEEGLRLLPREEADVQCGARRRRNDVRLVAALKSRDRDGITQQRVVREIAGEEARRGRIAQRRAYVRQRGPPCRVRLDRGQIAEIALYRRGHDQGRLIGGDARQGSHQPVDGIVRRRARPVAGGAVHGEVQPERRLLRGPHAVVLDPSVGIGPNRTAFGEEELGVLHHLRVVLHEPARANAAADLFVRRREEDYVAPERHAGALQREQAQELRDRLALHVQRAAAPEVAVLHGPAERVDFPVFGAREHDVPAVEQHEGPPTSVPLDTGVQVRFPGSGLEHLSVDPFTREYRLQPVRGLELVARRIRGVDRDVLRQQRCRLPADGTPLGIGARHVRLELPRRQEDWLRGRAEQAGLGRRGGAGRTRAGNHQGQRDERSETQGTSGWDTGTANYEPAAREGSPLPLFPRAAGPTAPPLAQCTVIVAWPALPSLVARRTAVPAARAQTIAVVP